MTKPLPKWVQLAYSDLLNKFKENNFSTEDAKNLLGSKTSVVLAELRKAGWIKPIGFDQYDSRKRFYKLTSPNEVFLGIEKNGTRDKGNKKIIKGKRSRRN